MSGSPLATLPHLDQVLTADEVRATGAHLASLQLDTGMIPWFPGGHCDPWNHVESAMALDVAGFPGEATHAYRWLAHLQRPDGSWHNYYWSDGSVAESKLDTNVCAYVATGLWHHWHCTGDSDVVAELFPVVRRALDWVLTHRRSDGTVLWAVEVDHAPWNYALLTGSSSIQHSLRCGAELAALLDEPRPDWVAAADSLAVVVAEQPDAFEPKTRWAMDWYYPVLTGAVTGEAAKAHLVEGWETFALEGLGIRCVSDEHWVTASETAECSLAFSAIGDLATATDLLAWTRSHRLDDGAYWTGIVHPSGERFPFEEHTSYTAAAIILAADAIAGASPASDVFARAHRELD